MEIYGLNELKCVRWNLFYTMRLRQNGYHFAHNTFKRIFLNENVKISFNMSLKFVPKSPVNNILALVHIMAWRQPRDNPLSKQMLVRWQTHIGVTWPQWINIRFWVFRFRSWVITWGYSMGAYYIPQEIMRWNHYCVGEEILRLTNKLLYHIKENINTLQLSWLKKWSKLICNLKFQVTH